MMGCKSCGKGRSSAVRAARRAAEAKLKAEKIARAQARLNKQNAVSGTTQEATVQSEAPSSEATVTAQPEPSPSGGVVITDAVPQQTEAQGQEEAQA
jgi:hypothetical protein